MGKTFLPPDQGFSTCSKETCDSCSLQKDLVCHFNRKQLVQFLLLMAPPFIFGGKFILEFGHIYFYIWLGLIVLYFGLVEIWAMCAHCPHYAEPSTKSLKCWANYSAPKLWKYKPGPMSLIEKVVFSAGMIAVFLYPLVIIILIGHAFFAVFYALLIVTTFGLLGSFFCTRCANFACILNRVSSETREAFFDCNPEIARAWKK